MSAYQIIVPLAGHGPQLAQAGCTTPKQRRFGGARPMFVEMKIREPSVREERAFFATAEDFHHHSPLPA